MKVQRYFSSITEQGRESLWIFETGKETLSGHEKGTFLPLDGQGGEARSGNYSAPATRTLNSRIKQTQQNPSKRIQWTHLGERNWVSEPGFKTLL